MSKDKKYSKVCPFCGEKEETWSDDPSRHTHWCDFCRNIIIPEEEVKSAISQLYSRGYFCGKEPTDYVTTEDEWNVRVDFMLDALSRQWLFKSGYRIWISEKNYPEGVVPRSLKLLGKILKVKYDKRQDYTTITNFERFIYKVRTR